MERMLETSGTVDLSLLSSAVLAPLKEEFDRCCQDVMSTIISLINSDEAIDYYRAIAIAHDVICFLQFPDRIGDNALHNGVIAHAPSFMLVRAENAVSSSIAGGLPIVPPSGPPDSEELRNLQRQIQELQSRLAAETTYNPDF
ncbi:hypothetical protein N7528_003969 [Penicillium herquei]|nr:hypothetical protein N7528_003969 [Penicillium herquei]